MHELAASPKLRFSKTKTLNHVLACQAQFFGNGYPSVGEENYRSTVRSLALESENVHFFHDKPGTVLESYHVGKDGAPSYFGTDLPGKVTERLQQPEKVEERILNTPI